MQNALTSAGLPQLVKKYPKLVDPLMARLLDTVGQFHEEVQEAETQQSDAGEEGQDQQQTDASGDSEADGESGGSSDENGDESEENEENEENEEKDGKADQSRDIREAVGHSFIVLNYVVFNPPKK